MSKTTTNKQINIYKQIKYIQTYYTNRPQMSRFIGPKSTFLGGSTNRQDEIADHGSSNFGGPASVDKYRVLNHTSMDQR